VLAVLALLRAADIVSGRKMLASPSHDHHAYTVVLGSLGQGLVEFLTHDAALRVEHFGAIYRDGEHGVVLGEHEGIIGHGLSPSCRHSTSVAD